MLDSLIDRLQLIGQVLMSKSPAGDWAACMPDVSARTTTVLRTLSGRGSDLESAVQDLWDTAVLADWLVIGAHDRYARSAHRWNGSTWVPVDAEKERHAR